jgi:HemY protein
MRRLAALIALALLAVAAATLADHPGSVDIVWQGWEVDTSVGVLLAALAVVALVLWLCLWLIGAALRLPRRFRRNRHDRRRRAGELALTRSTVALAAGDGKAAQRYAGRAQSLLGPTPLALMLAAQAAELDGDTETARRLYTALLDEKEAAFLGLRGLIGEALKDGDGETALRLAARAHALRPEAGWAFETLLALQARAGLWDDARETLAGAAKRRLLPLARADHHRGVILHELGLAAERAGERRRALSLAARAQGLAPELAALAVRHARLLIVEDRRRAARRIVEQAWRIAPHPALAALWGELGEAAPALARVKWFERLTAHNSGSPESAIALAEAALAAQLWGEARRHLGTAIAAQPGEPSRRLCLLMARLEESERPGETGAARDWADRALNAPPDPTYVCARCTGESLAWQALCPHCHGFDTLAWRRPAPREAGLLPGAAVTGPLLPGPSFLAAAGQ